MRYYLYINTMNALDDAKKKRVKKNENENKKKKPKLIYIERQIYIKYMRRNTKFELCTRIMHGYTGNLH